MLSSNRRTRTVGIPKLFSVRMSSKKLTYADVLKKQSEALNSKLNATALIPKATRVRLGDETVKKLRRLIHGEEAGCTSSESLKGPEKEPINTKTDVNR